jgi:hypothetical protein
VGGWGGEKKKAHQKKTPQTNARLSSLTMSHGCNSENSVKN